MRKGIRNWGPPLLLISPTVVLLGIFVYPALYYFVGRIGGFERRRERKKQEQS